MSVNALSRAQACDGSSEPTRSGSDDLDVVVALAEEVSILQHRLSMIRAALLEEEQGTLLPKYITDGWLLFAKLHDSIRCFSTFRECLRVYILAIK